MKYLVLFAALVLSLSCCTRQHVYHTYYGDIDIDTMQVHCINHWDCYVVNITEKDSLYWPDEWLYSKGPVKTYFNPGTGAYFEIWRWRSGEPVIVYLDPYHSDDKLEKE